MNRKALTVAVLGVLACALAGGQAQAQVSGSSDVNGNTSVGPCTSSYGTSSGGNLTLCTSGTNSNSSYGDYASGNIVIGSTAIAPSDATAPNGSSGNISIGNGNSIGGTGPSTSQFNVLLGGQIGVIGSQNVAIGTQALNTTNGSGSVAIGYQTLSGSQLLNNGVMTAVGSLAGASIGLAESSTLIGSQAGYLAKSMISTDVVGEYAGTFGSYSDSALFGPGAGNGANLNSTVAIGIGSATQATQTNTVAIGAGVGQSAPRMPIRTRRSRVSLISSTTASIDWTARSIKPVR